MRQNDVDKVEMLALLDEWFSEPDKMGEEFWQEYERELEQNPLAL